MPANNVGSTKQVVIDLKLLPNDTVRTIQDLNVKINNLKAVLKGMKDAGLENTQQYIKLEGVMKDMQNTLRANQKVLVAEIQQQKANGDSINALRGQLKSLRAAYEDLTAAERNSAKGTEMLDKIQNITTELKKAEEAQMDWSRSVGNYKSALEGLPFGKVIAGFNQLSQGTGKLSVAFKNGKTVVASFGKQLWTLMSNPFVAAIAAIVAVFAKLVNEIKKNDDALTAMQRVMAALKPILDIINKGFSVLVDVVAKAANAVAGFVGKIMSFIPGVKDYVAAEQELVNATDALEDAEREHTVNQAKREKEISELRNKSVDSTKYSFEQRKKFLEDALQLEQQELEESKNIAAEKYRIAEQEALLEVGATKMTREVYEKLSDEVKNHLAELEAAVYQTETAFNDGTRRMQSQIANFTKQEENERKQAAQKGAQTRKERLKNEREAINSLNKMWIEGIRNLQDKEYALTVENSRKEIAALKEKLTTEKNLTKTAKEAINRQIILMEADLQLKLGDLRKKFLEEDYDRQLQTARNYYQKLLAGLKDEAVDAQVAVKLVLNDMDTDELKKGADRALEQVKAVWEQADKDFMELDYNELAAKYADVWEARGITLGDNIAKMRALVDAYHKDYERAEIEHNNLIIAIDKASEEEKLKIRLEGTKKLHDEQTKQLDLSRKHAEILRQIELGEQHTPYERIEMEKTRIMLEQAQERVKIAQDEYKRLKDERQKYNDEELKAIYGSVQEYNNLLLEAQLKVVESENGVKDAVKAVSDEAVKQKQTMISTATAIMSSMNSILGSFQGLFETMAESDEKYADYATAMAMMQILVSTAISIANAIQGATAAGAATGIAAPFTTPAFIVEMVAIVAGAIASATSTLMKAKQQKQSPPKFSEGGLIGNKTTRRKDDTVTAKLTLGEYVIPAPVVDDLGTDFFDQIIGKKVKKLPKIGNFETPHFASGGVVPNISNISNNLAIDYGQMREIMREAMSEALVDMPNPVVSVKEVTNAQKRVQVKEQLAHF